ncbi:NDxxF motif lipoprotein [Ornithinibacillus sp. JPR2-1]|uniref:NDxxF motif lipoprotein n=1 Tax=Ornithinibacillus sp. JPR2-1 TaxID=2094019 RepID=UPI0031DDC18E
MRRFLYCFLILFILSACTQNPNIEAEEDEILSMENVKVPSTIFISEKQNSIINEEEIKLSIKTYLDSYEDLTNASYSILCYFRRRKGIN